MTVSIVPWHVASLGLRTCSSHASSAQTSGSASVGIIFQATGLWATQEKQSHYFIVRLHFSLKMM